MTWCQLRLLMTVGDVSGPQTVGPLLAQVRANVVRLGDPVVSAALHVYVGEMDAKRGLISNATKHTEMGQRLLAGGLNVWLEGRAENTLIGIDILRSEYVQGVQRGDRALELAERSGAPGLIRACVANLGNLQYRLGHFSSAIEYFERANSLFPFTGERSNGWLESIARVFLSQGRTEDAEKYPRSGGSFSARSN